MKNLRENSQNKSHTTQIDKSLNKYDNQIIFPEKLSKANEMLRKIGIPKIAL
jgi:hypothetical protein